MKKETEFSIVTKRKVTLSCHRELLASYMLHGKGVVAIIVTLRFNLLFHQIFNDIFCHCRCLNLIRHFDITTDDLKL